MVNSTADLPDASLADPACEVAPIGSQKCTLRAAIQQSVEETKTECTPCTILFDPDVFPPGPPGGPQTISIDESGEGLLPAIEVPLTIDASGAGVILEPDIAANGGTGMLDYGLIVIDDTPANPTGFTLIGNDFTIRGFEEGAINADADGDGIVICGHSVPNAFTPYDPTADDCDQGGPVENIFIDPVTIALNGDDAIVADGDGVINFNADAVTIFGNGSGLVGHGIELDAGTGDVTGSVTNSSIHSADDAVNIDGEKCHFDVTNNPILVGLDDAFDADCGDNAILDISDNGNITGADDDAVYAGVGVGSDITVNRNGKIRGGEDSQAIEVDGDVGLTFEAIANGHIEGGNDGIDITAGDGSSITIMDNSPDNTIIGREDYGIELTSLGDSTEIMIVNNGDIEGADDEDAIYISGGDAITADITDNGDITGGNDGIEFSTSDETIANILRNGDITAFDDYAIYFSLSDDAILIIEDNGNLAGGEEGIDLSCTDGNTMEVRRNGEIVGFEYYGIYVSCSDDNTVIVEDHAPPPAVASVAGVLAYPTGSIIGGEYGIYFSLSDDNLLDVQNNGAIVGMDDYGIYFSTSDRNELIAINNGDIVGGDYGVYHSTSDFTTSTITDNGSIEGWDSYGVYYGTSDTLDAVLERNGNGSTIEGGEYGVYFSSSDFVDAVIRDNGDIIGYDDNGIYCSCGSSLDFLIADNGDIVGGSYGIEFSASDNIDADIFDNGNIEGWDSYGIYCSCSDDVNFDIQRNGDGNTIEGGDTGLYFSTSDDLVVNADSNGDIIGYDDEAVYVSSSDRADIDITNNGDLLGGEDGLEISTSDDLELYVAFNGNIVGFDEEAIDVDSSLDTEVIVEDNGRAAGVAGGFFPQGTLLGATGIDIDCSDVLDLQIFDNGDIVGVQDDGIFVDCDTTNDILIDSNGDIIGGASDQAIDIDNSGDEDQDITITNNGELIGGDDALEIDGGDDTTILIEGNSPAGTIEAGDGDGVDVDFDDDSEVSIINNGPIVGGDGNDGVDIDGGDSVIVNILDNLNITGFESGIEIEATTLEFFINGNGNITGFDQDGIQVFDTTDDVDVIEGEIIDNGIINGHGRDGIRIRGADLGGGADIDARLQNVTISGNTIGNGSEDRGIWLNCMQTTNDCTGFGVVITDNWIEGNGEEGILLEGEDGDEFTTNTIGPNNTITQNGGPGIVIQDSNDNTIVSNTITWNGNINSGIDIVEVAGTAIENTISKNSCASNVGLCIDLGADGLGCPVGAGNTCLTTPPQPNVAGNTISGRIGPPEGVPLCAFCTVEAFITDNPPDPTGFGEGFHFIGRSQTDGTGDYSILVDKDAYCGGKAGAVTVTLTDEDGNTSEFSRNAGGFDGTNECPTDTPTVTETPLVTDTPTPAPATDTPTAAPPTATATATTGPVKVCGDADFDGAVTALDALHILQFKAGFLTTVNNASNADVNGEDGITSVDAALILQQVASLIPPLTGCV